MAYKITIEKKETVTQMVRGDWVRVNDTDVECYGYAPDREDEVTERTDVYEQTVEDLDIVKVIQAINSIGE